MLLFFPNVRIGDRYSRKCSDIIAGCITFTKYKGQFCNTVPSISLFKVQKRRIPSCLCIQIHSSYGEKQLPFVCKQTRGLSDLGVYHVIILAGLINYIDLFFFFFFFLRLISIYHFSFTFYFFKHKNYKYNCNTKLKTEKIDCKSYFGVMQCSVMRTLMYTFYIHCWL